MSKYIDTGNARQVGKGDHRRPVDEKKVRDNWPFPDRFADKSGDDQEPIGSWELLGKNANLWRGWKSLAFFGNMTKEVATERGRIAAMSYQGLTGWKIKARKEEEV